MFLGGTLISILLRILLKILYVDTGTGFYLGGNVLIYGFAAAMALTVLAVTISTLRENGTDAAMLRGNRPLEITATVLGAVIAGTSVPKLMAALAIDPSEPVINRLPAWLLVVENLTGLAAGAAFLYLAFCFYSGFKRSGLQGMLALPMVVWQAISMVERYISFQQVNTVSDQFIETMYLVFATLFLLANTRCMAGMPKSRKICVLWGLLTAHFGLVLIAGQLASMTVLGGDISGPPVLQILIIAALSLYALVVSGSLICCENN